MFVGLRRMSERNGEIYLLNKEGWVVKVPCSQKGTLEEYATKRKAGPNPPQVINELVQIGFMEFEDLKILNNPPQVNYDDFLIKSKDEKPVYPAPIIAHLSITSRCNMHCRYCSVRKVHEKAPEELNTQQYKKIINKLATAGVFQIGLTGGEPTVRPDIFDLIRHINKKGVACNITTNGWAMSKEVAQKLKKAGLDQAQVSLDSHIPEHHESLRGKGSYARAIRALEILNQAGIKAGVDTVLTSENINDIPKFIEFLEERKVPGLTLIKVKKGDLPIALFKKLLPDYQEYGKLIENICARKNQLPEVTIDCGSVPNLHYTLKEEEQKKLHSAGCPAGHTLVSIAPNGDLYPCAALSSEEFKLGNILENDLEKLWQENQVLRDLRDIKNNVKGACKTCPRLDSCRGGCRGVANDLCGLYESDPSCRRKEVMIHG